MAQLGQDETVELINGSRQLETYQNKLRPDIGIDARRSLFQKNWIAIGGLRFGVEFRRIHRAGIGIYFLNTRVFDENFALELPASKVEFDFEYTSAYYERVLYFDPKWETGATLHLGGGKLNVFYQNEANPNIRNEAPSIDFSLAELSVYGEYNFTYWISLGGGLGYRQVFGMGNGLNSKFSSPIFVANLQLKLFKLARSYFDESVKNEY